jgi:primase-polymerase (primpol)-like protein
LRIMSTTILAVHVDAIPAEMAAERRWVCWRLLRRRNRPTKVPVNPRTGGNASSTEPEDWSTLEVALACMDQEELPGIGFVLGDGWAGVDQDHCFDPATGTLETWAWDNVCLLDSYTEVSPRGEGVKTIVRGTLPPGRRRTGQVEMYDSGRFFATTGHHLAGTPCSVEERTAALHALHRRVFGCQTPAREGKAQAHVRAVEPSDEQTVDLRERAARGFIRRSTLALLDSVGAGDYDSPSEADAAIAAGLIHAGLTESEALAVLLDSARGRDAMERKGDRYGQSYWQRTVAHAAELVGPVTVRADGRRVRPVRLPSHRTFTSVRTYADRCRR